MNALTQRICAALRDSLASENIIALDEFPLDSAGRGMGRIDLLAIYPRPDDPIQTVAYEIKTSLKDYSGEVRRPEKRERAMAMSNYFYFVAPHGLLKVCSVPFPCGLIEVLPDFSFREAKPAVRRRGCEVASPARFLCDIERRAKQTGLRAGFKERTAVVFDLVFQMASLLIENSESLENRREILFQMSHTLGKMAYS